MSKPPRLSRTMRVFLLCFCSALLCSALLCSALLLPLPCALAQTATIVTRDLAPSNPPGQTATSCLPNFFVEERNDTYFVKVHLLAGWNSIHRSRCFWANRHRFSALWQL